MSLLLLFAGEAGPISATVEVTEAADTVASTAKIAIAAQSSFSEAADTAAATAALQLAASTSVTEAADTAAATAALQLAASTSVTEAADTTEAVLELVESQALDLQASVTEADDSLAASAQLLLAAQVSVAEAADAASATAALRISAVGDDPFDLDPGDAQADIDEEQDSVAAEVQLAIAAEVQLSESADVVASELVLEQGPIVAVIDVDESGDTVLAIATLVQPQASRVGGGASKRRRKKSGFTGTGTRGGWTPESIPEKYRDKEPIALLPMRSAKADVVEDDDEVGSGLALQAMQRGMLQARRRAAISLLLLN